MPAEASAAAGSPDVPGAPVSIDGTKHILHHRAGVELAAAGRTDAALKNFEAAIALVPTYAEAWFHRGLILKQMRAAAGAYDSFAQAVILTPRYAAAESNLAALGAELDRPAKILTPWRAHPEPGMSARLRHRIRRIFGRREPIRYVYIGAPVEADLRASLAKNPGSLKDALDLGRALITDRRTEAECFLRYAHALAPWEGDPVVFLGALLGVDPDRAGDIRAAAHAALIAKTTDWRIPPMAWWQDAFFAEWKDYDRLRAATLDSSRHEPASVPVFQILHLTDEVELHARSAEAYHRAFAAPLAPLTRTARPADKRITLGYFSADFRDHPCARLFTEMFEIHDRKRFRVLGFSTLRDSGTDIGRRVRSSFDKLIDLDRFGTHAAAQEIADHHVDILIDVTGNAFNAQASVLAARPASVQVSYLAFPGPAGSAGIDYSVVDRTVVPGGQEQWYREALVFMPASYQVNDRKRRISAKSWSRASHGLPETGAVYCCFNESRKITPAVYSVWMRILSRVPGSVLWLYTASPVAAANLRREAAARGIDPGRVIVAARLPNEEHLARYRAAAVSLDTAPYGAHTTASDALWAGCPVVTVMGKAFPNRVAASLLKAAGLPELITATWQEYEDLAVRIGADPEYAAQLRRKLDASRPTCALFDTPRFTRQIEQAYERMWQRHLAGRPPETFDVEPA